MVVATERRQSALMHRKIIDLPELMEHFEIHNRTEGKSPRTVEWYNLVLGQLCHWLESRDTPTTLDHADEMMIRRFILFLQEKPGTKAKTMSTHTMYNRVNALRSFFGWLHRQGYTDEHVLQNLKQPKTADLVIEPLNREEIDQIINVASPDFSPASKDAPGPFDNHQIAGDTFSRITLEGKKLGKPQVSYPIDLDAKGRLFLPLEIPVNDTTLDGGQMEIRVTDTGGRTGIGTFNLTAPTLIVSPLTSTRGSLVKVTGDGFVVTTLNDTSRYLIDIEYAGERVATTEINPLGAFDANFRIPSDTKIKSENVVSAKVRQLASEAKAWHCVPDASIALEPTNLPRRGELTIKATGFPAFQRVWIKVGVTWVVLSGLYTDVNGVFTHTFSLSEATPLGEQIVMVHTPSLARFSTVTVSRR